jgi:hypothetical protein
VDAGWWVMGCDCLLVITQGTRLQRWGAAGLPGRDRGNHKAWANLIVVRVLWVAQVPSMRMHHTAYLLLMTLLLLRRLLWYADTVQDLGTALGSGQFVAGGRAFVPFHVCLPFCFWPWFRLGLLYSRSASATRSAHDARP